MQTPQSIQFYQNRWNSKSPLQDFGMALMPLSRDALLRISRALGQQRPLARGLDKILERLLVGTATCDKSEAFLSRNKGILVDLRSCVYTSLFVMHEMDCRRCV